MARNQFPFTAIFLIDLVDPRLVVGGAWFLSTRAEQSPVKAVAVLIFDNVVVKVDGICTTVRTNFVLIVCRLELSVVVCESTLLAEEV